MKPNLRCRRRRSRHRRSVWTGPDTQTWPGCGQDVPPYQKWTFCVNSLKSYRPNRHTDRHRKHYLPAYAGGKKHQKKTPEERLPWLPVRKYCLTQGTFFKGIKHQWVWFRVRGGGSLRCVHSWMTRTRCEQSWFCGPDICTRDRSFGWYLRIFLHCDLHWLPNIDCPLLGWIRRIGPRCFKQWPLFYTGLTIY